MPNSSETLAELNKAGFKPLSEEKSKHYAAIGRFMIMVSNEVDVKLNTLLQTMISGDEISTRAVVGEMRIPDVMAAIRRIASARKLPKEAIDHMDSVFAEITPLRQTRDTIAHKAIWVKGNKMAFHNAQIAKTDSAIDVKYYTVSELNEFGRYARRLGYRVQTLISSLTQVPRTSSQNAFLTLLTQHAITLAATHAIKKTKVSKPRLEELNIALERAHASVKILTEIAKNLDPKLHEAQREASAAITAFAVAITQLDAPEPLSLLEVPARLRPANHQSRSARRQQSKPQ